MTLFSKPDKSGLPFIRFFSFCSSKTLDETDVEGGVREDTQDLWVPQETLDHRYVRHSSSLFTVTNREIFFSEVTILSRY